MRKASEALDDRAVSLGVVEHLGEGFLQLLRRLAQQPPAGGHRFLLHLATLGVLQRHVEEDPLHRIERGICPRLHARERERERLLVEIEGACAAPEHVARKLVEDDDQTQAPPRTVGPALELSGCGTLEELAEARADLLVALGGEPEVVLAEPEGHALVEVLGAERESSEPELADAARLVHGSILTCCGRTRRASRAAPRIRAWSRGTWSRPP